MADQRRYSEGQGQKARSDRFSDATRTAQFNSRFEALQRAEKLGLIAATDIGKIEIEDMALKALAQREAAEDAKRTQFRNKAKTRLDKLARTEEEIVKRIQTNQSIADAPIQPEANEIRRIQERLAKAANPKEKTISDEMIAFKEAAAIEEWKQTAFMDRMQRAQAAKIDAANDKMLLREIAQERNSLMQMSGEIGDVPETVLSDPGANVEPSAPTESPMAKLQRDRAEKIAAEKAARDAAAGGGNPSGGYGGVRGALGSIGNEFSSVLNNAKLAINKPLTVLGRGYDSIMGGDKAVLEGEPARNQRLARLVQDYNQTAGTPISFEQAAVPLASRLQEPQAPAPLTYEQFLQFQEQLKKPLPKLNPLRTQSPSSVFSFPDPYGLVGN